MSWPIDPVDKDNKVDIRKNPNDYKKIKSTQMAGKVRNQSKNRRNEKDPKEKKEESKFQRMQDEAEQIYSDIEQKIDKRKSHQMHGLTIENKERIREIEEQDTKHKRRVAIKEYEKQQGFRGSER